MVTCKISKFTGTSGKSTAQGRLGLIVSITHNIAFGIASLENQSGGLPLCFEESLHLAAILCGKFETHVTHHK